MNETENKLTAADLLAAVSTPSAAPSQAVNPIEALPDSVPLPELQQEESSSVHLNPGEIALRIVQDCNLQDALAHSVCLTCANRVLAQDSSNHATLYCTQLFRDLESCITRCTGFIPS